jgi:hypothetical protein
MPRPESMFRPGTDQAFWRYYLFFRERTMGTLIEHILQVFGKKIEPDGTEETLLDFLSKKPGTEERTRAVEEVDFLKDLRT